MSLLDLINKSRAKMQGGNKGRPEKLQSERNLVRFMIAPGAEEIDQVWGQHFIKDTAGNLKAVYICTATMFDEPCPVCEAISAGAAATGNEELLEAYKEARASRRVLVNALYLKGGKHDNPETNPVVLELPPKVWDMVITTAQEYAKEEVNVFDPVEGINFVIEKTGSGKATTYKVTPAPKSTKIDPELVNKCKDLREFARQESVADRDKAVTSVRVIGGYYAADAATPAAPKLVSGPAKPASRLADLDAEEVSYEETPTGNLDSELDEFLDTLK